MTERSDQPTETTVLGDAPPVPRTIRREPRRRLGPSARTRGVGILTTAINVITWLVVLVLGVHILFVVFKTNGANSIVSTVRDWADTLAWQFKDVFVPDDPKVSVLVNYGLAAIIYLIVGKILLGLVRRLG